MMSQEKAYFAAGCFWGVEAICVGVTGVLETSVGYMNGETYAPTYQDVCTGRTQHAEAVEVIFDNKVVTFNQLLWLFWHLHDPTQLNRQGVDVGTQYRSAIFYHSDEQKATAEQVKKETDAAKIWDDPIVTEISKFTEFYKAESYHQDYYNQNSYQPYCMMVINPKLNKFKKEFSGKLKK
jgi:peptide-methionine (S)-S-oxide reductase